MALTPLEIHNKEFKTKMRGFDQDEVNEFLDKVIRDYELLIRQNKELSDDLELANKKLANYEEMQESLNKSIIVAQDAADRLKENADKEVEVMKLEAENEVSEIRKEADAYAQEVREEADEYAEKVREEADDYSSNVHKTAADNADELLKESVLKARKIEEETEALRKHSRVFRQRLQLLVESQLELLNSEDWDNLLVGQPIEFPNTETILEVAQELEEKEATEVLAAEEEEGTVEAVDSDEAEEYIEYNEAEYLEEDVSEDEEAVAADEFAIQAEAPYNSEDNVEENDYAEGTTPAVELPEATTE